MATPEAKRRRAITASFVISECLVLLALLGPLLGSLWWRGFRVYAYQDQLSYASIATNWANGSTAFDEPYTQTGVSHYPSLWYQVMGLVSRITGVPVYVSWTAMGVVAVSAAVLASGWLALRMSRAPWSPVLPAFALFTGVLAVATAGSWYVSLRNHAVLWGPLESFFTLNSEVAGTCIVVIAFVLIMLTDEQNGGRFRPWPVVLAAGLLGLNANIHTYGFFAGVTLAMSFAGLLALSRRRSRGLTVATFGLLAAAVLLGPLVARLVGPFPTLGLLLVAFVPAAMTLARTHVWTAAAAIISFSVLAGPQVIRTLVGVAQKDPFLTYRQTSSSGLGVDVVGGIIAGLPLILVAIVCAQSLWGRRQHSKTALLGALGLATILMAQNDRWGFNQEPYRFWILFMTLAGLLVSPILAWSLLQPREAGSRRARMWPVLVSLTALVWLVSLADTAAFWHVVGNQGVFDMQSAQAQATRTLVADRAGLIMPSACVKPQVFKVTTGARVAHYNRGLAWPENVKELYRFQDPTARAADDPAQLQAAGVAYVITDSTCARDWNLDDDTSAEAVDSVHYGPAEQAATLTLWAIPAR